jgi:hypothetical protein
MATIGDEAILGRVQRHAAGTGPAHGLGIPTVLRRRPRGAVIDYRIAGLPPIVAKSYRDPERVVAAERAWGLLGRCFDATSAMRVPALIACFPATGVLLMRRADGVPLPTLVDRPADWDDGVRGAGRWLARLHQLEPRGAPLLAHEAIVERLARRVGRAAARRPESAALLTELLAGVLARSDVRSTVATLTHGRFHPGHVFVDRTTVTIIDLDGLAVADPGRDLGEFLGRLSIVARRTRQDARAREDADASFIGGYREGGGTIPASIPFHRAATMLGIMAHLIETGHPRLARRIEHCVAELRSIPVRAPG